VQSKEIYLSIHPSSFHNVHSKKKGWVVSTQIWVKNVPLKVKVEVGLTF